ncbi:MAG: hypothetical protein JNG90_04245, partial [Planctomycetaceae bacterium]|nr:hypothetical protein [Planctomycetaceae bacterium]
TNGKDQLATWEQKYGRHPGVRGALAKSYFSEDKLAAAERNLKEFLKYSKDWWAYEQLADIQKQQNNLAGWQQTLEESLEQPDYGLYHAQARVQLANYYLEQKSFDRAIPHAERAAQTGACWAMQCASKVHEAAGNLAESERWVSQCTTRYRGQELEWLWWCSRNGVGDFAEAIACAEPVLDATMDRRKPAEWRVLGLCYAAAKQPRKALELLQKATEREPAPALALWDAVFAAELNETAARDAALKLASESQNRAADREAIELATWLQSAYAAGGLKEARLDVAPPEIQAIRGGKNPNVQFFLGKLLLLAGRRDDAVEYLKASAGHQEGDFWSSRLARLLLAEQGIQVERAPRKPPAAPEEKTDQG